MLQREYLTEDESLDKLKNHEEIQLEEVSRRAQDNMMNGLSSVEHSKEADDEEPALHARTWMAVAALVLLNFVQIGTLSSLIKPYKLDTIGTDLNITQNQNWIPNSLSLVQAVAGPITVGLSYASDVFQARKILLVTMSTVSLVGCAIAPGATSLWRIVLAQTLIGFGFAAIPLAYSVPSEILPRRWRPMAQASLNVASSLAAVMTPLVCGILTERNPHTGWRYFYWFQLSLWGTASLALLFGYSPLKRKSGLESLTMGQKLYKLDLPGMSLLACGLTLLLTGISSGGNPWSWSSVRPLSTLISGAVVFIGFALWEWKGTSSGILHHDLFTSGRTFPICIGLIFIEGILIFTVIVFYPAMSAALFTDSPVVAAARQVPFWLCAAISTLIYGYWSTRRRAIRGPLATGFVIFTAGIVGLATVQPSSSTGALVFDGLAGLGLGAPLILVVSAVQLSTPPRLIATASAVVTTARAISGSMFTAIYGAAVQSRTRTKIPAYIADAAVKAGLAPSSIGQFIQALLSHDTQVLMAVPGVNGQIIGASVAALQFALADSFRTVFIIAAPFGLVAVFACYFIPDLSATMSYRIDAPVEKIVAKEHGQHA